MPNNQSQTDELQEVECRRRARRLPLPVEVTFETGDRIVAAMIRDVAIDNPDFIGIGILHRDLLPLDERLSCCTSSDTETLPAQSNVVLTWTRHYGNHGYLSGGRMVPLSASTRNEQRRSAVS